MIRKNIVNVALGILLLVLIISVIRMNNPKNIQKTKPTKKIVTKNTEKSNIWILPASQTLKAGQEFDMEIIMNTQNKDVGAFNLSLNFDPSKIIINTEQGVDIKADTGKGFHKGNDAKEYIIMSNSDNVSKGKFRLAGMGITKTVNGEEKHMVIIHAKTTNKFTSGKTEITLKVNEFSDILGKPIATGESSTATIIIQ